jgi:regulator of nucleoside diphosphate kinase
MVTKSTSHEAALSSARNPIHITSRDKQRLEDLLAEAAAMRAHPRADLNALGREVDRAVVVKPEEVPNDVITMNSRAELRDLATGERLTLTLAFPSQANIEEGKISVLAPIGAGMLGYRVGDEFEWQVPDGIRRMRVTKIHYQPEAAQRWAA